MTHSKSSNNIHPRVTLCLVSLNNVYRPSSCGRQESPTCSNLSDFNLHTHTRNQKKNLSFSRFSITALWDSSRVFSGLLILDSILFHFSEISFCFLLGISILGKQKPCRGSSIMLLLSQKSESFSLFDSSSRTAR